MQRLINQHTELSVKFIAKLFLVISVTKGDCHAYAKKPDDLQSVIMPFKYTDEKENFLYAWRAFSYGKEIEIFC